MPEKSDVIKDLEDSEEKYRTLIGSSIDALVTFDKDGLILDVNEETIKLTGYSREELIGTPFKNYFTDPEKAQEGVDLSFREGIVRDYELIMRSKTGEETIVSYNATVYRNSKGEIEGVFAAARDITESKELGKQLQEAKDYNRELIESSIDALVTFDKDGLILDVNEETIKLTGYSREELIGTPFKNYFTDPEKAQEGVDLSFREGIVRDYELIMRSKTGEETIVSYNATVYRTSKGEIEGVFAAARDITEIKKDEERFSALYELSTKIDITTEELLDFTADEVAKMLNPDMCYITTLKGDNLFFRALRGDAKGWIRKGMGVKVNKTVCGFVIDKKKPIVIPDIKKDPLAERYPYLREYGIESYMGIPLLGRKGKAIGTICVLNKEPRDYSEEDIELLSIFASRVSLAIGRARIERELLNARAKLQERATELQKLMTNLRESEEKYRTIFESANDVIVTLDLKGNIMAVNSKVEKITGYRREELMGKNIARLKIFPPKSLAIILKNFGKRIIGMNVPPYEVELIRKEGKRRFIEISATPLKRGDKIVGDMVILRDITKREEMEREIRKFKTISDMASYGTAISDLEGNLLYVNEAFAQMHGYMSEELIGKNLSILHTEEQIRNVMRLNEYLKNEGSYTAEEVWHKRKDDTVFPTLMSATLIKGENGIPLFLSAVAVDITERKKMEEKLREKMDELERFNKLMIGRELKMVELKREINTIRERLGKEPRYKVPVDEKKEVDSG